MLGHAWAAAGQAVRLESRAARQARHDYHAVFRSLRSRLQAVYGSGLGRVRLLDFGCGFTYPLLVLLEREVGSVVGVDVAPVYREGWRGAAGEITTRPGAAAGAALHRLRAVRYYHHLARESRVSPHHGRCRIVRYDGTRLPFRDGVFDGVISNAVLQELAPPLERYARELARVLRPGGPIDLEWHNFYSWSGHYLPEAESRRHPWGHLLGGRWDPCLNRLTPPEYLAAFEPWFRDLRLCGHDRECRLEGECEEYRPEGEAYLTPSLEARLAPYPRAWLLTRGFVLRGYRR